MKCQRLAEASCRDSRADMLVFFRLEGPSLTAHWGWSPGRIWSADPLARTLHSV